MTKRRINIDMGGDECAALMDYAPSIVEAFDDGRLHGHTDFGDYSRIYFRESGTCAIPGCFEPCGSEARYCEAHQALGRQLKAKARHSVRVARRLLAQRRGEVSHG